MIILWRTLLLVILHIGVLVLFPNYPASAPLTVLILFASSFISMLILSAIFSILWLSRSMAFMALFDFLMVVSIGVMLLLITPQSNNESPADKLMRGKYPTITDVQTGWSSFKLLFSQDALQKDITPAFEEFNRGVKVLKDAVEKDKMNGNKNRNSDTAEKETKRGKY